MLRTRFAVLTIKADYAPPQPRIVSKTRGLSCFPHTHRRYRGVSHELGKTLNYGPIAGRGVRNRTACWCLGTSKLARDQLVCLSAGVPSEVVRGVRRCKSEQFETLPYQHCCAQNSGGSNDRNTTTTMSTTMITQLPQQLQQPQCCCKACRGIVGTCSGAGKTYYRYHAPGAG